MGMADQGSGLQVSCEIYIFWIVGTGLGLIFFLDQERDLGDGHIRHHWGNAGCIYGLYRSDLFHGCFLY
jgi:hypothetical protein